MFLFCLVFPMSLCASVSGKGLTSGLVCGVSPIGILGQVWYLIVSTVKSQLSERRLFETTWLFESVGQSRLFSLLSIAIKLPIIRISIIRKIQFFEVIRRSRLKKMLSNYPSRFEVQMSCMVIMISLFGRVRFTHLSDLEKKVETGIIEVN